MRDFLYNFGFPYKSQTLHAVTYPNAAVYKDRRVYAYYIAKAMNLMQEDYVDRMSVVGNQGRHIAEAFCAILAPACNAFSTNVLANQITLVKINRGDMVSDGAVSCMRTLRKIGNTTDHLHLEQTPADKSKAVDAVYALVKDVYAFFRRFFSEDSQRAAEWANNTSAVKIYLSSINLGKCFPVFVRTGFDTMDGLLELSNDLRRDAAAIEADLDALERNGMERGDRRTFKRELVKLTEEEAKAWEMDAQRMRADRLEMEREEAEYEHIRQEEEQRRQEEQKRNQEENALMKRNDLKSLGHALLSVGTQLALYDPSVQRFLAMTEETSITIFDLNTLTPTLTLRHASRVKSVIQLADGRVCSGSFDRKIKIWDLNTSKCKLTLSGHTDQVLSLIQLVDGRLCSGSCDCTIKIWDLTNRLGHECMFTFFGHSRFVVSLIQLIDGRLCSGSDDGDFKIWDLHTNVCVMTISGHTNQVYSVIQLADGRLCSGSNDFTIKIWDLNIRECVVTLSGHSDDVKSVIQLFDGRVCSGSYDRTIKIWDLNTRQCVMTLSGFGHVKSVIQLADGLVCCGSSSSDGTNGKIKLWDLNTRQCVKTLSEHPSYVISLIELVADL